MTSVIWIASAVGAALLVVAGIPKTSGAVSVPFIPSGMARPLGVLEIGVGAWVLVAPDTAALVAMAAMYCLLAASLSVAILRRELDCGFFGVEPVKPGITHLVVNVAFAASAVAGAAAASSGLTWFRPDPNERVLAVALALLAAVMLAELLSTGADLRTIRADLRRQR